MAEKKAAKKINPKVAAKINIRKCFFQANEARQGHFFSVSMGDGKPKEIVLKQMEINLFRLIQAMRVPRLLTGI